MSKSSVRVGAIHSRARRNIFGSSARRNVVVGLFLSLAVFAATSARAATHLDENWEHLSGTWADDTNHGSWTSVYNGYGKNGIVTMNGNKVFREAPRASRAPEETHASLLVSRASFDDMSMAINMQTAKQLRTPAPNPWEVAWAVWHYTDDTHFYYAILKPNGWEIGKEDPSYPDAQRFLATGSSPTFPVGRWYYVRVVQRGATFDVYAGSTKLASVTDDERPYLSGRAGLYNEDADVRFDRLVVSSV